MIKEMTGDLIQFAYSGLFDVIVHGCNCHNKMGSGLALHIKSHFPEAYEADLNTAAGDRDKLGTFTWAIVEIGDKEIHVINAYTQFDYGTDSKDRFEYDAFRTVCKALGARYPGKRIGMPKIGSGLAGGNWERIKAIIEEELKDHDVTIVNYRG